MFAASRFFPVEASVCNVTRRRRVRPHVGMSAEFTDDFALLVPYTAFLFEVVATLLLINAAVLAYTGRTESLGGFVFFVTELVLLCVAWECAAYLRAGNRRRGSHVGV